MIVTAISNKYKLHNSSLHNSLLSYISSSYVQIGTWFLEWFFVPNWITYDCVEITSVHVSNTTGGNLNNVLSVVSRLWNKQEASDHIYHQKMSNQSSKQRMDIKFLCDLKHSASETCEILSEINDKKPWRNQEFLSSIYGSKTVDRMWIVKEAAVQ